MKRLFKDEEGQSLVLIALCMTALMGFLGLAIDVGLIYRTKQNAQIAADAAAVAGAQNLLYGGTTATAVTAGKSASSSNGFTDQVNGVNVTINTPPTSGPNQSGKFVEAIVSKSNLMSFAAALGRSSTLVPARAVAGTPVYGNACIWLMATSGTGLSVQGSYNIDLTGCGIYVNSPSNNAIGVTGNGGSITAKFVDTTGNVTPQHQTSPTAITKNTAPRKNPWGTLTGPNPSANPNPCNITYTATSITSSTSTSLYQGSSTNSVVCFTQAVSIGNGVTLPGAANGVTYLFENGLSIPTGATVTFGGFDPTCTYCSLATNTMGPTYGATIDLYGGTFSQASSSVMNLFAPTAGSFNGIGLFQPSVNTNTPLAVQFGSNSQTFDGYVYALGVTVSLHDSGGSGVKDMGIIANAMTVQTAQFSINSYDVANAQTTPNRIVSIVE